MAYDIAESVLECIGTYQLQLYGQVKNIELYCTHFQNKIKSYSNCQSRVYSQNILKISQIAALIFV